MTPDLPYEHIEGKTYTLFGQSDSTRDYYRTVRELADQLMEPLKDRLVDPLKEKRTNHLKGQPTDLSGRVLSEMAVLLNRISRLSSKRRRLNRLMRKPVRAGSDGRLVQLLHEKLQPYTMKTGDHLKGLPFLNLWDRRLGTTREQYHLYMIEIELTNRLFRDQFLQADRKIALLPYCLQDFSVNCKASVKGFDRQCNHCSGKCFENKASLILEDHGIEPYIWRDLDFRKLATATFKKGQKFAVFGIACIPELVWGMRKCRRNGIPVMGLPLNANRCTRWFGEFFQNSIDLDVLEDLVRMPG